MKTLLLFFLTAASLAAQSAETLWQRSEADRQQASAKVAQLLARPLTVSRAVQVALLNNRRLQATFEQIGIARADVLEAVTVPNPSIDFEVQFPFVAGTMNRYGWLVAQEFVQLVMIPLKKRLSEEALSAAELRVAAEVLDLVAEAKVAYFTVQADRQIVARLGTIRDISAASLQLSQAEFQAGNITDLALLKMQDAYNADRLVLAEAEAGLREHQEEFNQALGLWGMQTKWTLAGDLPQPQVEDFSDRRLESLAVAQRADLLAAQRETAGLVGALGLSRVFRWVPVLDFGFSGERDIDGALNLGPQFRLEVPVFNQGQARLARGTSELRRSSALYEALAVEIRSNVRKYRDSLASLGQRLLFYRETILPTKARLVDRSLLEYNAMQIGPADLFAARAGQIQAECDSIKTLRDYWITRARLEQAVGGSLTPHAPPRLVDNAPEVGHGK